MDITVSPTELTEMVEAHSELDHVTLASMTEGYTAADLKDLVGGALQQAFIRSALASETVCSYGGIYLVDMTSSLHCQ